MKIKFFGDRNSIIIRVGRFLKRIFPKMIIVEIWDGYPSIVYLIK